MLLDNFLPVYDFGEVHVIVVHAPPGRIFRAIKEFTPAEIPLLRTLLQIRSLPARLAGKGGVRLAGGHSLFEQFLNAGFVLLAEEMDRELVVGRIGQFWKMWGGLFPKIADTGEFLAFDRPGYAKAAVNFYVHKSSDDGCVTVSTETHIFVPDPITRKKFAAYWRMIYPGSAFIRRMWLRAIKRRVEQD